MNIAFWLDGHEQDPVELRCQGLPVSYFRKYETVATRAMQQVSR